MVLLRIESSIFSCSCIVSFVNSLVWYGLNSLLCKEAFLASLGMWLFLVEAAVIDDFPIGFVFSLFLL